MTLQDRATRTVDLPDPDLSPDELVARATEMRDTLRSRQDECEELGRLPDTTAQDYIDAGFFRVLQPRRFGGYEFGLETFLRITAELSRGCPSSGWVYGLMAGHNLVTALFDEQGQVELFGDGDFRCPLSNLPVPAVKADGGYVVSGGWDYSSGCDVATHFIGGAVVAPTSSDEPVDTRWVAMRRDQYEIIDNWNTLGMRGTGSRRVVVENLFIPEHHTVPSPNPTRPVVEFPGRNVHANPIYRAGPLVPLLISEPAAVAVGVAQAAIDEYIEVLTTRHQYGPASPLRADLTVFQRVLGQATALVDTAEAALWHVARSWTEQSEHSAATGVPVSDESERRLILIEQQVIELCSQAVELVFRTGGSTAARKGERIERYFRDLNMVRTHVTLQYERTWENVGQLRLGMAPASFF
ncbi:MAG TPA: acyl-CoA dehydrogenase family protein [Ilumatobacteraceae bacterium]|nr:acyl-CoA dehydrogenase family protein [Ilumatobacteraceae bacterium]